MVRKHVFTALLLCLISTVAIADPQQDPDKEPGNSVEETERQKIITELSYRLETKLTCAQKLIWSDKGSGADLDGFFFTPSAESSYFIIGGYASRKGDPKSKKCIISVRQSKNNPEETPELLVPPSDWSLIWTDKGSGANTDGSMWNAVPPGKEYKCLGSVMQKGYKKPVLSNYRCVHSGLTKKIQNKSIVWTDKGSGADRDVTVFNLSNSKSFFAVGRKTNKVKTFDLNDTASIKPDAAVVENLLAKRMGEINKIEEAEKKSLADEEAKKRLAEATASNRISEQKRISEEKRVAEEAKKKQEAEEVERQERLSEEAENKRLEQEAEKKHKAEGIAQQERLKAEVEHENLEQGTEDIQKAEEPEQQSAAEVVVVQQPDVSKEINQQQATIKADKKDSKAGLKILFVFMLLLLIYTSYKVFRVLIDIIKGDN